MSDCTHRWGDGDKADAFCKDCRQRAPWRRLALDAWTDVARLQSEVATANAAHLETKRDASQAWTEHLSDCWQAETIEALEQRDSAIRQRDDARRQTLQEVAHLLVNEPDSLARVLALLEDEPSARHDLLSADKQGYERAVAHSIVLCHRVRDHKPTAGDTVYKRGVRDGAIACAAALRGHPPHRRMLPTCTACGGSRFVACKDCSPCGCVVCAETKRVRCTACDPKATSADTLTRPDLYVELIDGSPFSAWTTEAQAIDHSNDPRNLPWLTHYVPAERIAHLEGQVAQADLVIFAHKNQEAADQYRIAALELQLKRGTRA